MEQPNDGCTILVDLQDSDLSRCIIKRHRFPHRPTVQMVLDHYEKCIKLPRHRVFVGAQEVGPQYLLHAYDVLVVVS